LRIEDADVRRTAYEPGVPIADVFFPLTAVYSIVAVVDDQRIKIEVATVGREGMVGLPVALGTNTSPQAAFCQIPGETVRLGVEPFRAALTGSAVLRNLLNRFVQATLVEVSQNVVCNRSHSVPKRMARWLLTTHDRVHRDEFPLTEEFLGQMLGVYRPTVADAARHLQMRNVVHYGRNRMTIVDRPRLEREACECYRIVAREFAGLQALDDIA
jgi:CRP-like cAMP-binding protein